MRILCLLIFITILTTSCEEKIDDCPQLVIDKKLFLEQSFKNLHNENVSQLELDQFKLNLEQYLQALPDKKCLIDKREFYAHSEVRKLLFDITSSQIENNDKMRIKVVYGEDDRVESGDYENDLFNNLASSVAAQIPKESIGTNGELLAPTLGEYFNLCSQEKFRDQLSAANCSGFLIDTDLLVTAGHCITSLSDCEDNYWVFDYLENTTQVETNQLYSCKEIVSQQLDGIDLDYAVIRLDRVVSDRAALRFRTQGTIADNTDLVVIGHPSGLPQKIAGGATVKDNQQENYFSANLDTFGGNSGSPVFNALTGRVEGILVRGDTDYITQEENGKTCTAVNYLSQDAGGEEVTRISVVEGLPDYKVLSFEQTYQSLFSTQSNQKNLENESFVIPLYTRKNFNVALAGRRFLDACISHLYELNDVKVWPHKVEFNCEDKEDFMSVYESYVEASESD